MKIYILVSILIAITTNAMEELQEHFPEMQIKTSSFHMISPGDKTSKLKKNVWEISERNLSPFQKLILIGQLIDKNEFDFLKYEPTTLRELLSFIAGNIEPYNTRKTGLYHAAFDLNSRISHNWLANQMRAKNKDAKDTINEKLYYAIYYNESIKPALQLGASIDAPYINGMTPLMLAVSQNNLQKVQELLDAGANTQIRNKNGQTALDIAYQMATLDPSIAELLKNASR